MRHWDFIVIGGGSGGVRAARRAAMYGAKVLLISKGALGGTCVNVGCIPKKLYSYAAQWSEYQELAGNYGWEMPQLSFDLGHLANNVQSEIKRLNGIYQRLLVEQGVTIVEGAAKIVGNHQVSVNGNLERGERVLIATGSTPYVPQFEGSQHANISDAVFALKNLPRRMVIIGGGYIASELACIFHGLGAEVHQVVRGERLLKAFDASVVNLLMQQLHDHGLHLHLNCTVNSITHDHEYTVHTSTGAALKADFVLCATGRIPNTAGLGLSEAGIRLDEQGGIIVDEHYQTSLNWAYAVGDVLGKVMLTPVALAEAEYVAARLFDQRTASIQYKFVPTAIFTHPAIGVVGYNEDDALLKFGRIRIYSSEFASLKQSLSSQKRRSLFKLIVDDRSDKVVGAHLLDDSAPEIIQLLGTALQAGLTKAQFDATLGVHPTVAEELVTLRNSEVRSL